MKLILARHGETVGGSSTRYWGRTDVELSVLGLEQAGRLKARLKAEAFSAVYASGLKRAQATAEAIISSNGLAVTSCAELNEVDFGELEGLSAEEIRTRHPEFYKRWQSWDTALSFPGGESVRVFHSRVCRFADRLKPHSSGDHILVIAHAGSLRMLMCHFLGLPLPYWRKLRIDLASVSVVELLPQGAVLTCLNDTSHLA